MPHILLIHIMKKKRKSEINNRKFQVKFEGEIRVENMMKKYKVFLKTSDTHSENQFSIHGRREKVCV